MKGKVCIVTGASSGIGEATALGLSRKGATVVPLMRRSPHSDSALARIGAASAQGAAVLEMYADLASQSSIRQFAVEFDARFDRLDVLINNAGIYSPKKTLTSDGIEETFAVNVLAPFLLTNLLLGKLKSSAPSRIVNVSSNAAAGEKLDFDNLQGEKGYSMFGAYGRSKLELNILTSEFARRLKGTGVTANFLHPGVVRTRLMRGLNPVARGFLEVVRLFFASPEKGARTSIYVATSPELESVSGQFFSGMKRAEPPPESFDATAAARLWNHCEELTRPKE